MKYSKISDNPVLQYGYNLALAIDQLANAILLGDPDESISGRTGRAMKSGNPKWWIPMQHKIIDAIFYILFKEKDHCFNGMEPEERPYEKELWSWSRK